MFHIIPDNFFVPLSSPNRIVYWECISRLFAIMEHQFSFGVEREVLVDDGIIKKINVTEEEVNNLPEKEAVMAAQMIADNMDYSEDDIYLERYQKELEQGLPQALPCN